MHEHCTFCVHEKRKEEEKGNFTMVVYHVRITIARYKRANVARKAGEKEGGRAKLKSNDATQLAQQRRPPRHYLWGLRGFGQPQGQLKALRP